MKKYFFIGLLCSFAIANRVYAAEINIIVDNNTPQQYQALHVNVTLDTQGDSANAVQGEVIYPADLFTLSEINDGSSSVSFWMTPPAGSSPGQINFAGIIPGGFSGSQGNIFSFTLQPVNTGSGTIAIATPTVLANDGNGSPLPVIAAGATVTIIPSSGPSGPIAPSDDYTPPNSFIPQITSDPNIFGGKYFLIFNTTDAQSGIDHYEVLEVPSGSSQKPFSAWQVATSPYLLTDQDLSSDIYVRAVDHNGNFIVVKVPARYPHSRVDTVELLVLLLIVIVLLLLIWIWHRRKRI